MFQKKVHSSETFEHNKQDLTIYMICSTIVGQVKMTASVTMASYSMVVAGIAQIGNHSNVMLMQVLCPAKH